MLIITDGSFHDMPDCKNLIYDLSQMPCSIIIIGVGNADFSGMEELDDDWGHLANCQGKRCPRDIVQFVSFNEAMLRGDLAAQVLKEVPNQMVSYMEQHDVKPKPVK